MPLPEHAGASPSDAHRHTLPLHHWRGALRELVIIVAGVLGALAGQAWWEARRDRLREQEYLRQLLTETRENERRLGVAVRDDSLTRGALARLAEALYDADAPPTGDSAVTLFTGPVFSSSNFEPLTGSYDALVSAGDLRLIRTDSLRAEIVAYRAKLDYEQRMLGFFLQQAFGQPGELAKALPFMRGMFTATGNVPIAFRRSRFRIARLRDDPEFAGFLFGLEASNANRLMHLRMTRDATVALRRMLEAESRDGGKGGVRGDSTGRAASTL